MARRAQLFSSDLAISFSVVLLVIILTTSLWIFALERKHVFLRESEIHQIARDVSFLLVESPGHPSGWTDINTTDSIGLASTVHTIDPVKLGALLASPYNETLRRMGVIGPGYGMRLRIDSFNGTGFAPYAYWGLEGVNTSVTAIQQRYALLEGNWVRLTVKVWQ